MPPKNRTCLVFSSNSEAIEVMFQNSLPGGWTRTLVVLPAITTVM